jgi:hypothetical protein
MLPPDSILSIASKNFQFWSPDFLSNNLGQGYAASKEKRCKWALIVRLSVDCAAGSNAGVQIRFP